MTETWKATSQYLPQPETDVYARIEPLSKRSAWDQIADVFDQAISAAEKVTDVLDKPKPDIDRAKEAVIEAAKAWGAASEGDDATANALALAVDRLRELEAVKL